MKILVISHLPERKFSARLHLGFLRNLETIPGVEYKYLYGGYVMQDGLSEPQMITETIEDVYQPDVVLHYDSHAPHGHGTIFSRNYFAGFTCPTIMIEVDMWKQHNDMEWYSDNEFNLILTRGATTKKEINGIPIIWLPFSVDEKEFCTLNNKKRARVIGFAGAHKFSGTIHDDEGTIHSGYQRRRIALKKLDEAGLLLICKKCGGLNGSRRFYSHFLKTVAGGLSATEIKTPVGKIFEIMASGTALLTSDFMGKESLFGTDWREYISIYADDCNDIVQKARDILNQSEMATEMGRRARKIILDKHTHVHRINELYGHLQVIIAGDKPVNKWNTIS